MRLRFSVALLALAAGVIAVVVAILLVQSALADGDPASDTLISQQLFLPLTVPYSLSKAGELSGILDNSKKKGFPLKVAVIARPADLGAVPSLFGRPRRYARFLGQEDYYFFKDMLLVVMPQGYGLYKHAGVPPGDRAAIAALPRPSGSSGDELIAAADTAVRKLAARRGLELSAGTKSTRWRDRGVIVAGVLVLCAVAFGVRWVVRRR
jgi:hypothetical protein